MSQTLLLNQPLVTAALDTLNYTVPTGGAGIYNVQFQGTNPASSSLAVIVQVNSSTKYTAPTLTPTQTALQFRQVFNLADADAVSVQLSSAAAVDNALEALKSTVSIGTGM